MADASQGDRQSQLNPVIGTRTAAIPTDRGSALVETILIGLLLTVPLIWLLSVLAELHLGALAATSAAREAGAQAGRASDQREAQSAIAGAVEEAFVNHGLEARSARVSWDLPRGFVRGAAVDIEIAYPIRVFRFPFIGEVPGISLYVRARHTARIEPFASRE